MPEAPFRPVEGELGGEIYILGRHAHVFIQRGHPQGEDAVLPNGLAFGCGILLTERKNTL